MTAPKNQWYAVVRDTDVTEISGTGVVAWVQELDHGFLMWWDTVVKEDATETMEWFDTAKKFHDIHGHDGCTRLVAVEAEHADRGRELASNKIDQVRLTLADAAEVQDIA